jgi:hypothetical protein
MKSGGKLPTSFNLRKLPQIRFDTVLMHKKSVVGGGRHDLSYLELIMQPGNSRVFPVVS